METHLGVTVFQPLPGLSLLPASRRLAEIAFAEQKWDEAVKAVDVVLKKSPSVRARVSPHRLATSVPRLRIPAKLNTQIGPS